MALRTRINMLTVAEAQARLLARVAPLPPETVALAFAAGRRAAADTHATLTSPPFAVAAMDGYAICWTDRAGPWRVVGEAAAGRGFAGHVGAGGAARIFTGAPLPAGTDTVIVQEDVARDGETLRLTGDGPPGQGAHIRRAGLDFATGDRVVAAGEPLTPARLGLLAASGHGSVAVRLRPRVALLTTGDELVAPGIVPGCDQIVNANSVMLAALLCATGAEVVDCGIVPDRRDVLAAAIRDARDADVLVTVGGASVGDHDLVVPVLTEMGAAIDFWKVALRPGKPLLAGTLGGQRIVGLPGNPVSAFVCALLFVAPLLRALGGDPDPLPRLRHARLGNKLPANGVRQDYLRATLDDGVIVAAATQDSSMLRTLAVSNALLVRAPGAAPAEADQIVDYHALDFVPGVA